MQLWEVVHYFCAIFLSLSLFALITGLKVPQNRSYFDAPLLQWWEDAGSRIVASDKPANERKYESFRSTSCYFHVQTRKKKYQNHSKHRRRMV